MNQKIKITQGCLKKPCYFLLFLLLLLGNQTFAKLNGEASLKINFSADKQSKTITGKVVDKDNLPLTGVNVILKKSTVGAFTDFDGNYTITIPASAKDPVLEFSFLGFKTLNVTVANKTEINVVLEDDVNTLDEIVVIGYGSVAKQDLTGSVGTVEIGELQKAPVVSFDQALAGRVAGVVINSSDGQPGAEGLNIVIRGANSLTQNNGPLYVIDGFPLEEFDANSLNPDDIKSITILKDASSTAIYGARGANGVVVIETKKGVVSKPKFTYTTSYGFNEVVNTIDMMDAFEFVEYSIERDPFTAIQRYTPADLDPASPFFDANGRTLEDYRSLPAINWQDELFRPGVFEKHGISLRGGTEDTKYSISGSIFDTEGVIVNTGARRYQGRISLDQRVTEKLKTGVQLNYSNNLSSGQSASAAGSSGSQTSYLLFATYGFRPITGSDGPNLLDEFVDITVDLFNDTRVNPVISAKNELRRDTDISFRTNAYISYELTNKLKLRMQGGIDIRNSRDERFYNSQTSRGTPLLPTNVRGVQGSVRFRDRTTWSSENTLTYNNKFGRHKVDFVVGNTLQNAQRKAFGQFSQLIPLESLGIAGLDQGIPLPNESSASSDRLMSFFGRAKYNYKWKYYLTATFRADGSSRFAPGNRWGYFPSVAASWRMTKEDFLSDYDFINESKLRLSYGTSGNNRVTDFAYVAAFDLPIINGYSFNNGTPTQGVIPTELSNRDLKWETTRSFNIGYDLSLFNRRVEFTADWYRKNTDDLLLNANIPFTTGYTNVFQNVGEIQNQGLELSLNTVNVKTDKFEWSSNFNISFNENKILALNRDEDFILSTVRWDTFYNDSFLYIAKVGEPASQFFGYVFDGIYQTEDFIETAPGVLELKPDLPTNGSPRQNIKPGDIRYRDLNGDLVVDDKDQTVIGRTLPKHTGGFTNNFSYGNFNLNVFLQWSYGNDVYNANRIAFEGGSPRASLNQFATYADRWTPTNPSNTLNSVSGQGPVGLYSSRVIEDGSFLRLKTVSLDYSLPESITERLSVESLSLSLSAQNLVTWTNYTGVDPEVNVRNSALTPGFDFSAYPRARTVVLGLNVKF